MDTSSSALNSAPKASLITDYGIWIILAIIILGLIYVVMTFYSDIYTMFFGTTAPVSPVSPVAPGAPVALEAPKDPKDQKVVQETWCLVGEDLAGRYCVKVPGPQSCTQERSYLSQDQCTLTPAMKLPAGILKSANTSMKQLSSQTVH